MDQSLGSLFSSRRGFLAFLREQETPTSLSLERKGRDREEDFDGEYDLSCPFLKQILFSFQRGS